VTAGALVTAVAADSPAAEAGLRAGDVVVSVGDRTVTGVADVTRAIRDAGDDASVELGVVRDQESLTITATLPARPRPTRLRATPI
jgi:S1-C subfamily serine protease